MAYHTFDPVRAFLMNVHTHCTLPMTGDYQSIHIDKNFIINVFHISSLYMEIDSQYYNKYNVNHISFTVLFSPRVS